MSITQLNFDGKNKVEVAIMRLQEFKPPEDYYGAYSGGKDSDAVRRLSQLADVPVEWHYAQGGIDPPELVRYIRECHPDTIFDRPSMSVWKGIQIKGMPRRQSRWCCELIKEQHGGGRRVITGIRWAESQKRKRRQMVEVCRTDKTKIFVHPIIDWTSDEVWEFIRSEGIPYCKLYDEGFKRIGCVLCPMETARQTQYELKRFPKLAEAWKRACYRYFDKGGEGVKRWETAEDFWLWWLSRKGEPPIDEAQCIMFDND